MLLATRSAFILLPENPPVKTPRTREISATPGKILLPAKGYFLITRFKYYFYRSRNRQLPGFYRCAPRTGVARVFYSNRETRLRASFLILIALWNRSTFDVQREINRDGLLPSLINQYLPMIISI